MNDLYTECLKLHRSALTMVQAAAMALCVDDLGSMLQSFEEAYYLERRAAEVLPMDSAVQLSKAVLFHAAATFALKCGRVQDAKRMVAAALSCHPKEELRAELRILTNALSVVAEA